MKKNVYQAFALILLALLTACSNASAAATSQGSGRSGGAANGAADSALATPAALAVGIFKLDGSANAVNHEQAAALLPLWKALRMEATSKTPVTQEISAVVRQIETTLKPEQVQAITDLKLTNKDMFALMREKGLGSGGGGGGAGNLTPEQLATRQAGGNRGGGGGFPGGGFPGGGFGGPGGGGAQTTPSAARISSGSGVGVNVVLINAVIDYLKAK
jgi:hypothetical protein